MRSLLSFFMILVCFSCKNNIKETEKVIEKIEKSFDFSSIPKDTVLIKGKQLLYVKPSKEEFDIIKDIEGIEALDEAFEFSTFKIMDSLRWHRLAAITSKRIIGIVTINDTTYIDRLNTKNFNSHNHYSIYYINTCNYKNYTYRIDDNHYFVLDKLYEDMSCDSIIERKYVIAQNGLNIRTVGGDVVGKFNNGDMVNIIGYTENIIEVEDRTKKVKGRWAIINYEDFKDGRRHKKRYVFEGYLGDMNDVKVYKEDLINGSILKMPNDEGYNDYASIENLSRFFNFELISEDEFNSVAQSNSNFLTKNPLVRISKNNDETVNFNLPIKDSVLVFKSKMDYSAASYEYYGDLNFLNAYLIHGVYYKAEEANYSLINKHSGKQEYVFPDFPHISPSKNRIFTFYYDVYEEINYFHVYGIKSNNLITLDYAFTFPNWINFESDNVKWLSNNTMVFKIVNPNIFNGSKVENPQYLKLYFKK
ncbi:hypothetical protein [Winogradskyella forsetii]|uniref:hypothetical protein n=1 Tax=Winogradskyella forsetii TaxID=2686077 RepID=UPI0015BFF070|nr:hypothetical protein [Winogradskyella forsetii]